MQEGGQPGTTSTQTQPRRRYRYRSPFWGIVLIAVGAVLLLYNFDVVERENLAVLAMLWPILLVGIGVDLLVGRRSWVIGGLVGVVTVGLLIVLMLAGPGFGWVGDTDLKTETYTAPVDQATSARVTIDSSRYDANIRALEPSSAAEPLLLTAWVQYQGTVDFESSEGMEKLVNLSSKDRRWWWGWLELDEAEPWVIELAPSVPLHLSAGSSSGTCDLDLSQLQLTGLDVHMSSGSVHVALPAAVVHTYPVGIEMSSGDLTVVGPAEALIDMSVDMSSGEAEVTFGMETDATVRFNCSSGRFTMIAAEDQAIRVEVRSISSGDVDLPDELRQVSRGDGEEGIWETEGYSGASRKVLLVIEHMSSGDVNVNLR